VGATKQPLLGLTVLGPDVAPGRSPGPLGLCDAADPNVAWCAPGDTPGPVGTAMDAGAALLPQEPIRLEVEIPVLSVDLYRLRRLLSAVAYIEEADLAAKRGFGSSEIELGDPKLVDAAAAKRADALERELREALAAGPEALAAFIERMEQRKTRARESMNAKFAAAQRAGQAWVSGLGGIIKGLSVLKFASTVTVKTLSMATGPVGTGIDLAYSGAQAGIEHAYSKDSEGSVQCIVAVETLKNLAQEAADIFNEFVADGLMSADEKKRWQRLVGNFQGNTRKLESQLAKVEEQIRRALERGAKAGKVQRLQLRQAERLAKLQALRKKTLQLALRTGTRSALAKKAAGKTLSVAFLANDVKEAWNQAAEEWRLSD
jgi:polyhydroxyalkanoate synthesis regulator phasin